MTSPIITNILYIHVDADAELLTLYKDKAKQHNIQCQTNHFADSGFDLFCPGEQECYGSCNFVDHKVKCAMFKYEQGLVEGLFGFNIIGSHVTTFENNLTTLRIDRTGTGFYLYPRSSISKTVFRLANNVGIIDSGYRGNIGTYFDIISEQAIIKKHQRLVQLCAPSLEPFYVQIIEDISDMPCSTTARGTGGFGSTDVGTIPQLLVQNVQCNPDPLTIPPPSNVSRSTVF